MNCLFLLHSLILKHMVGCIILSIIDEDMITFLTPDGYQFYNVPRRHNRGG